MRATRRAILGAAPAAALAGVAQAQDGVPDVMVSTWDFGRAANAAGWERRLAGGSESHWHERIGAQALADGGDALSFLRGALCAKEAA